MINFYRFHNDELDCHLKYSDEITTFLDSYELNVGSCNILHIIMKDPYYAYEYSMGVLNGRWEEAEPYIMKDAETAYYYATTIIKGRWPEAEPIIKQHEFAWDLYRSYFNIC